MRSRVLVVLLACLGVAIASIVLVPGESVAVGRLTLARPHVKAHTVVLRGNAPARSKVRIVRRTADGWKRVATDRTDRRGRYRVEIRRPGRRKWVVRAVAHDDHSRKRRIRPASSGDTGQLAPPGPVDACGEQPQKEDGTYWQCSFVDDFDGTALDPGKWLVQDTSLSGIRIGDGCFTDPSQTLAVADGALRLTALHTATSYSCSSPYGDFTTDHTIAAVTTKGRFNQAYGRFEFRAKLPDTRVQGTHSALWLYPDQQRYGQWPASGEIDVAEWYSALPDRVYPSLHYVDGDTNVHSGQRGNVDDVGRYHTYAVEWTPTTMRFFYDDEQVYQHSWTAAAPLVGSQPFDAPFNVVLTQAWGQLWNAPTDATPDQVTMTVDWVRVWQ